MGYWRDLWDVIISYLLHSCPVKGRDMARLLLPRVPTASADDSFSGETASRVLELMATVSPKDLAPDLHAVLARDSLSKSRLGDAVLHYVKAERRQVVRDLCLKVMRGELEAAAGSAPTSRLLRDIVGSFREEDRFALATYPELEFLSKYVCARSLFMMPCRYDEFHTVYVSGDHTAAAGLLTRLITSDVAPREFWMTLLLDALPMLEGERVVFNIAETYELMRCLEEYCAEGKDLDQDFGTGGVALVRMALTRNLARAIFSTKALA